jgi:hypothetical protein
VETIKKRWLVCIHELKPTENIAFGLVIARVDQRLYKGRWR